MNDREMESERERPPHGSRTDRLEAFSARAVDFEDVLGLIEQAALSSLGRRVIRELVPREIEDCLAARARCREAFLLGSKGELPGLAGLMDPVPWLEEARGSGRSLEVDRFLALRGLCEAADRLAAWGRERAADAPALSELLTGGPSLLSLVEEIDTVLDDRGRVRPDASPLLARLGREEGELARRIERDLSRVMASPRVRSVLSDGQVHRRGGRPVLAVKAQSAGAVRGITHDRSQSEATVFVEPQEVVEAGNRLGEVKADRRREEERLLLDLTRTILARAADITEAARRVGELELAVVCEAWGNRMGARVPFLPGEPGAADGLLLRTARHPILMDQRERGELDEVVPIDLRLGGDFQMLIITGPNTGGKTLALKTAGLFALMVRCGLPVPCEEGSTIPLYEGIVADIGDEQEVRQNLSTFASHLVRIRDGLTRVGPDVLCLLDELGGGTDPDEGAALGEALLEHLLERNVPTLASTHLGKLKEFAFRHARAENACVEFDVATLSPLYRILVGTPGESGALVIARRLGLPEPIVDRALECTERHEDEVAELLVQVGQARAQTEKVRTAADERLAAARRAGEAVEEEREKIERRSEQLEAEAQRGLEERVRGARDHLRGVRALMPQVGAKVREDLEALLDRVEVDLSGASLTDRRREFLEGLSKGKLIYLPRYRRRVLVKRVHRSREEVTVQLGKMKLTVSFDEVTWYESL
jgi:DNA mismatch repair protein MutS2